VRYAVRPSVLGIVGLHATTPDNELLNEIYIRGKVRELNELYNGYERMEQLRYKAFDLRDK